MIDRQVLHLNPRRADGTIIIGVVSDTHVPDRVKALHQRLLGALREQQVDLILHAGDICIPAALAEIEQVAPVIAVRGNRDLLFQGKLPLVRSIEIAGIPVALMHGHGGWIRYFYHKFFYFKDGYRLDHYHHLLHHTDPEARVIIFGHSHCPENRWENGRLIFNPGTASLHVKRFLSPTFGKLVFENGAVKGEIIRLDE